MPPRRKRGREPAPPTGAKNIKAVKRKHHGDLDAGINFEVINKSIPQLDRHGVVCSPNCQFLLMSMIMLNLMQVVVHYGDHSQALGRGG